MSRKIVTFNNLSDKLSEELAWRRKEIQLINSNIPLGNSPTQTTLLRAAVPFLYGHWEGFVKVVTESYLEFVANKFLKNSELKSSFLTLSILKKIGAAEGFDFRKKVQFVEILINEFEKRSNVPIKDIINTKSNLWYRNFEEIVFVLSLELTHFRRFESVINDLVDTRNYIAHGHHLRVDYSTYFSIQSDIIHLMTLLKTEIENTSVLGLFKELRCFSV